MVRESSYLTLKQSNPRTYSLKRLNILHSHTLDHIDLMTVLLCTTFKCPHSVAHFLFKFPQDFHSSDCLVIWVFLYISSSLINFDCLYFTVADFQFDFFYLSAIELTFHIVLLSKSSFLIYFFCILFGF